MARAGEVAIGWSRARGMVVSGDDARRHGVKLGIPGIPKTSPLGTFMTFNYFYSYPLVKTNIAIENGRL